MVDKETLKKHNLKAVPFSCIGEGDTFYGEGAFQCVYSSADDIIPYLRRLTEGKVCWADGTCQMLSKYKLTRTVYVPVWHVTEVVL